MRAVLCLFAIRVHKKKVRLGDGPGSFARVQEWESNRGMNVLTIHEVAPGTKLYDGGYPSMPCF
jgi:hypothetical protein